MERKNQIDKYICNYIFDKYCEYGFHYDIKRFSYTFIKIEYNNITINISINDEKIRFGIDSTISAEFVTYMADIIIFDKSEYIYQDIIDNIFALINLVIINDIENLKKHPFVKKNLMKYYDD